MRAFISRMGVLRTGGLLLVALHSLLPLHAQQQTRRAVEKSARVVERGANHARWEVVSEVADPFSGQTMPMTNTYEQLESGLNYQTPEGEWVEASDQIEVLPGEAVARHGQHKVRWAANINSYGAIELTTADGQVARSHVLGLTYYDPTTGDNAVIAQIKDSNGAVGGNQVFYQNAFDGVSADIRYTYKKSGISQDLILREQLPDPAELGFDPATVQVQVMTEFVDLPAATTPPLDLARTAAATNNVALQASTTRYSRDTDVRIGAMQLEQGRAFALPEGTSPRDIPVRKLLEQFEGNRTILLETVDYRNIQEELSSLPIASKRTAMVSPSGSPAPSLHRPAPPAPERQVASIDSPKESVTKIAMLDTSPNQRAGFVLDYDLNAATTNSLTLQGDTTYYVTGLVTATNITTIEGGTVVKFASTNNAELKIKGTIKCLTGPYRPAVFTAKDDDTVGTAISGSSGSPSGYYAVHALNIDDNTSDLRYIHIRHARQGVYYGSGSAYPHFLTHAQMVNVGEGVVSLSPVFYVRNALFNSVITNFTTTGSGITGNIEHLTSDIASRVNGSGNLTLNITNSLLVQITNSSSYSGSGNATAGSGGGVFQTVRAGAHYLAGNTYRDAGVTNISYRLLSDFRNMTTTGPMTLTNTTFSVNMTLAPLVARDTDVPDIGYHYAALDYFLDNVGVTNATLTLTNGVCVGVSGYGTGVRNDGYIYSEGKPTAPNWIVRYNTVQEQETGGSTYGNSTTINAWLPYSETVGLSFRFTRFSMFTTYPLINAGWSAYAEVTLRDCEAYGGKIYVTGLAALTVTNCLFERSVRYLHPYNGSLIFYNNTSVGGTVDVKFSGNPWTLTAKDNLYDQTTILQTSPSSGTYSGGYNGYVTNYSRFGYDTGDKILSSSPSYQLGPLGSRYLPPSIALIDGGSRNSTNAGLYHFTTLVDQTKETNSTVDIGYHYVAAVPAEEDIGKGTMSATASSTCCGWLPAYAINDSTSDAGWVNANPWTANEWLQLDLGSSKTVDRFDYIPRQGTRPSPPYDGNNNGTIRKYEIYVTDNPASWGSVVASGWFNWPNGQERRAIEFNPKSGRYVILKRIDSYGWYGPYEPNSTPSYGYAGANEVWLYQWNSIFSTAIDTDGDTLPDYFEDSNGDGSATGDATNWQSYNSPNGISSNPGLSVYTPLQP